MTATLQQNCCETAKAVTRLTEQLQRWADGEHDLGDALFREILPELHQIAARELHKERRHISFTPSDLIDETWAQSLHKGGWKLKNRGHFYALAAKAMRRVLIDLARRRLAQRRNCGQIPVALEEAAIVSSADPEQLIAMGLLLERLEGENAEAAAVVDMHYIAGYTHDEIAARTGMTRRQVRYLWQKGSEWLQQQI